MQEYFQQPSGAQKLSASDLMARCAATPNDNPAWQEFLHRYLPAIHSGLHRVLGQPRTGRYAHLFSDALQRFFVRVLANDRRALQNFHGGDEKTVKAYLRKIATRVALEMIPQKERQHVPWEKFAEEAGCRVAPALCEPAGFAADYFVLLYDIDTALEKILRGKNKYRNMLIFKLHFFYGFSPADIAVVLGLQISSDHAIEQLIYRTREKLAPCLRSFRNN